MFIILTHYNDTRERSSLERKKKIVSSPLAIRKVEEEAKKKLQNDLLSFSFGYYYHGQRTKKRSEKTEKYRLALTVEKSSVCIKIIK